MGPDVVVFRADADQRGGAPPGHRPVRVVRHDNRANASLACVLTLKLTSARSARVKLSLRSNNENQPVKTRVKEPRGSQSDEEEYFSFHVFMTEARNSCIIICVLNNVLKRRRASEAGSSSQLVHICTDV